MGLALYVMEYKTRVLLQEFFIVAPFHQVNLPQF